MSIVLFDLAAADPAIRFSPYCWRIRLALAHKGLPVEAVPWRFTEKDRLPAGNRRVPVIVDGDRAVGDSWAIAEYLDAQYPERPSLFGGPAGRAHARFVNGWADGVMLGGILRLVVADILRALDPRDHEYFRRSREERLGATLECVQQARESQVSAFRASLAPLRPVLRQQDWLGGDQPSYADYIVFGGLQWARCISRFELLEAGDAVAAWRGRVMDLFGGLAASARTV